MDIKQKTIGQIVDEWTIAEIRKDLTGVDRNLQEYRDFCADKATPVPLHAVNRAIWMLIDEVMNTMDPAIGRYIQQLNSIRTNMIRDIDTTFNELENSPPAKEHD